MPCSITISQFCPFMKHTRFRNPVFLCCGPCSTLASHDLMISHSVKDRSWCRKKTDKAQLISPLIYKGSPRVKIDLIHSGTHPPTSSEIFVNCRNWQTINSNSKREERGHTLEPLHNKTKVRHCKQLSVQYLGFMYLWTLKDLPAKAHTVYLVINPGISFGSDTIKTSTMWEPLTH